MGHSASVDSTVTIDDFRKHGKVNEKVFHVYKDSSGTLSKRRSQELSRMKFDFYMSYDDITDELGRVNHQRVKAVNDALNARNIITSFNEERGIPGNHSYQNIEFSQLVLVFISKSYEQKLANEAGEDSCKKEFIFAERQKTNRYIVPLIVEPRMRDMARWTGPLANSLANHPAIDYSRDDSLADTVETICQIVNNMIVPLHEWNVRTQSVTINNGAMSVSASVPTLPSNEGPARRMSGPQKDLNIIQNNSRGGSNNGIISPQNQSSTIPQRGSLKDPQTATIERLTRELEIKGKELEIMREDNEKKTKELEKMKKELDKTKHELQDIKATGLSNGSGGGGGGMTPVPQSTRASSHTPIGALSTGVRSSTLSMGGVSMHNLQRVPSLTCSLEGVCQHVLSEQSHYIYCLLVAPNGDIFSGSRDKTIVQYRVGDTSVEAMAVFLGHTNWVTCLAIPGDEDTLVSGSLDKTIRVWTISSATCVRVLTEHTAEVCCCLSWLGETVISGGCDHILRHWDINTGTVLKQIEGAQGDIWCMTKVNDDVLATGEYDEGNMIRIYSISKGTVLQVLSGHQDWVRGLALGLQGELISVSKDCSMKIWTRDSKMREFSLTKTVEHPSCEWGLLSVVVTSDGSYITASNDFLIRIWDESNNFARPSKVLEGHTNTVRCLALTVGEALVSGGDDKTVRIWS